MAGVDLNEGFTEQLQALARGGDARALDDVADRFDTGAGYGKKSKNTQQSRAQGRRNKYAD